MDLAALREIFKDNRMHNSVAKVLDVELLEDFSAVRCLVEVFPRQEKMVATMTWESVGPGAGDYFFPVVNDLVLVTFADGDETQAFITRRISSVEDFIPVQARDGSKVSISLKGKSNWVVSDTKINLAKGDAPAAEPVVLGTQLQTLLGEILAKLSELSNTLATHTHSGNLGYPTAPPMQAADIAAAKALFDEKKASPVEDGAILSKLTFTD